MASETPPPLNIHPLPTMYLPTQPPTPEPYAPHRDAQTPIVIDNGSTTLRWGFGTSDAPASGPNAVAQYQERKTNKPLLLFGKAIDVESGAQGQARTPWEGDVLLNFDALVSQGIDNETGLDSYQEAGSLSEEGAQGRSRRGGRWFCMFFPPSYPT